MVVDRLKGKTSPEWFSAITLDDISQKLSDLLEFMEQQTPSGPLRSVTFSATEIPTEVDLGTWLRAAIYNDGSGNIQVHHTWQLYDTRDSYLGVKEMLPIDRGKRTTEWLFIVCPAGSTATGRIFYE